MSDHLDVAVGVAAGVGAWRRGAPSSPGSASTPASVVATKSPAPARKALTTTAVADRAGVTRRAVYLHFPTRRGRGAARGSGLVEAPPGGHLGRLFRSTFVAPPRQGAG
jgi:hypothetical protein